MAVQKRYYSISYQYDISLQNLPGLPISTLVNSLDFNESNKRLSNDQEKVLFSAALTNDLHGSLNFGYDRLANRGVIVVKIMVDNSIQWMDVGDYVGSAYCNVGPGSAKFEIQLNWVRMSQKVWKSSVARVDLTKVPELQIYRHITVKKCKRGKKFFMMSVD
ncbi:hypothetical protein [Coastal Plains virus]|uniref:Uncharacterized protein U2 n=1 Tax=Coastal Plains virus TaxID=764599 RepID=D8V084_9RHAB|nr:hypothetical protein [Coastal Plains virus]ADG86361.1 hypothetical protein [Coastal Plains virus]